MPPVGQHCSMAFKSQSKSMDRTAYTFAAKRKMHPLKVHSLSSWMKSNFLNPSAVYGRKKIWAVIFIPILYISATVFVNIIGEKRDLSIPVTGASSKNWDKLSYWYYPWGTSGFHKGIDIFAPQKTAVTSPSNGIVVYSGYSGNGGNHCYILAPDFRIYYFAHLNILQTGTFSFIRRGHQIGTVGNSGNAIGSPYHLHFSIFSIFPLLGNYSSGHSGWKKMFYLDPNKLLIEN
jgi:murein DD-endopeptidase MepM/ murein hydrolase activator NlpD